jgi:hypothetical protein
LFQTGAHLDKCSAGTLHLQAEPSFHGSKIAEVTFIFASLRHWPVGFPGFIITIARNLTHHRYEKRTIRVEYTRKDTFFNIFSPKTHFLYKQHNCNDVKMGKEPRAVRS